MLNEGIIQDVGKKSEFMIIGELSKKKEWMCVSGTR